MKKTILFSLLFISTISTAENSLEKTVCQQNPSACTIERPSSRNTPQEKPINSSNFEQIVAEKEDALQLEQFLIFAHTLASSSGRNINVISMTNLGSQEHIMKAAGREHYASFPTMLIKFTSGFDISGTSVPTLICMSKVPYEIYTSPMTGRQLMRPFKYFTYHSSFYTYEIINAGQCVRAY